MVSASEFKKGIKFLFRGEPYMVMEAHHVKPGKGGAFQRTKMKNLITGLVHEETFRSEDKFQRPDLEQHSMRYLYKEDNLYYFMDDETYETVAFEKKHIEEVIRLLKEQALYSVLYFSGKPIAVTPPLFMELKVVETVPGIRGDTAQGAATKPATLETGLTLQIPLFVNENDIVKVDTRDERYIERIIKK